MTWKTIRLELASTADFPSGSPGRAYLLRVPLDADGRIDNERLMQFPSRATARRFWASEPDQFGQLERLDGHYVVRCDSRDAVFRLPAATGLALGQLIDIEGPDGILQPFRVASVKSSNSPRAGDS